MKIILFLLLPCALWGQGAMNYDVSNSYPFGRLNPDAPKETADFAPMIGTCDCISTTRKADQTWGEPQKMTWTFKYIMNGMGVQDETLKDDGSHSGSIRQFVADSSRWYVHWYSNTSPSTTLPSWEGNKRGDSIVLYREQKAPNGMDGFYRLTFKDITNEGYNWVGEWVDTTEKFVFPTWTIECKKRMRSRSKARILENAANFSKAYMKKDSDAIANFYTEDAKIFPNNAPIIAGREDIKKRWSFLEGTRDLYHKITPSEVKIIDDYAYDYGLYEGSITSKEGKVSQFKGKYVIVWRWEDEDWKIYLDIWNRIK